MLRGTRFKKLRGMMVASWACFITVLLLLLYEFIYCIYIFESMRVCVCLVKLKLSLLVSLSRLGA